jgi:hypothetical protein
VILKRPFGVDKDVVDVSDDGDVEKVSEYVVDKLLTRCGGIG